MAGDPIKVKLDAEADTAGIEQTADALGKVDDGLEKIDSSGDDAARALDKVAKAGETAADAGKRIDRDLTAALKDADDAAKQVGDTAKDAGKKIGDDLGDGSKRAQEGMDEIGESARQNAIETAASFDGTADSIADGFQGMAAEMFVGFGPAAAAAGIAATLGLGILRSRMEAAKEKAQETAEQIADITGELIDLGSLQLSDTNVIDGLRDAATTAEDGKVKLREWADTARVAGISFSDYARGMAGDSEALKRSYAALGDLQQQYVDKTLAGGIEAYGDSTTAISAYIAGTEDQRAAIDRAKAALEQKDFTLAKGTETAQLYNEAVEAVSATELDAADAAAEHQAAQESLADAIESAADPINVYQRVLAEKEAAEQKSAQATADATADATDSWEDHAKDVQVTVADMLADLDKQITANKSFRDNLATLADRGLAQGFIDEIEEKGPEAGAAMADLLAKATDEELTEYAAKKAIATGARLGGAIGSGINAQRAVVRGDVQSVIDHAMSNLWVPPLKVKFIADTSLLFNQLRQQAKRNGVSVMGP